MTVNIFLDMDGTLFECLPDNWQRQGIHLSQRPYNNIDQLDTMIRNNPQMFWIVSTVFYDWQKKEKMLQIAKYLPALDPTHIILTNCDKATACQMALNRPLSQNDILFDDYYKNLDSWPGGIIQRAHRHTNNLRTPRAYTLTSFIKIIKDYERREQQLNTL